MFFDKPAITKLQFVAMGITFLYDFHTATSLGLTYDVPPNRFAPYWAKYWVHIHYPCPGPLKVRIHGTAPEGLLNTQRLTEFVGALLKNLGIPESETYQARLFRESNPARISTNDRTSPGMPTPPSLKPVAPVAPATPPPQVAAPPTAQPTQPRPAPQSSMLTGRPPNAPRPPAPKG